MSREIDSGALRLINRILGIKGVGSAQTELIDGDVSQVIDIVPVVRRSKTLAGSTGWFYACMRNAHGAGASDLETRVNPYTTVAGRIPPWPPRPFPVGLDIWILGACLEGIAGTVGNMTDAILLINPGGGAQAWGEDDGGTNIIDGDILIPLARWDDLASVGGTDVGITEDGRVFAYIGQRLRPFDSVLSFRSTASNAVTVQCNLLLGLFPVGLGQDVTVSG